MPQQLRAQYTHEAMVDLYVTDPSIPQHEVARIFGVTPAWISTIYCSDSFQARLAARRAEVVAPLIKEEVEARFKAVTQRSLEILQEKLAAPSAAISDDLALKAASLGAKALGMGLPAPAVNVVMPSDERLRRLADNLTGLLGRRDAEVVDV